MGHGALRCTPQGSEVQGRTQHDLEWRSSLSEPPPDRALRVGSLCAGIGGFDFAAETLGWRTEWFVEIDRSCQHWLREHFPGRPIYHDLKTVEFLDVPRVDIITAGFPCQPHSHAGKRAGINDERWLWPWVARCVGAVRPRFLVLENTIGLLSVNDGAAFGEIIRDLAVLGYRCRWDCLSAAECGAPHKRERLWLVGESDRGSAWSRHDARRAGESARGRSADADESVVNAEGRSRGLHPGQGTEGAGATLARGRDASLGDAELARSQGRGELSGASATPGGRIRVRPWADAVPVRGHDGKIRLVPREAAEAGPQLSVRLVADGFASRFAGQSAAEGQWETGEVSAADRERLRFEALCMVHNTNDPQAHQRETRGRWCVCAEKVLLSFLCQQSLDGHEERSETARREVQKAALRSLWCDDEARCAPHRREPLEQLSEELANCVSRIPNALAPRAAEAWMRYSRSRPNLWPVTAGRPGRVARIRACGNAVIPEWALQGPFRFIQQQLERERAVA